MQNILVTGGAGYVGNILVPLLLNQGYHVTVYDIMFFGKDTLPLNNPNLRVIEGDIRDIPKLEQAFEGIDCVLHLACISNDPSFELNENLSKTINFDCFEPMVIAAKNAKVKRFIYCSSSSVYGVATVPDVTEETPLVPLTLYNKFKGMCEPLLLKHMSNDFICSVIRPATVCGYSPRMRFDLSVNILTNHAVNKGEITVFGGTQERPNLHIDDMCDLYSLMITAPSEKIQGQIFNAGYQNHSILDLANMAKKVVEAEFPEKGSIGIKLTESNDKRSYRINSDKIKNILGFVPKRSVEDAVRDICNAFKAGKFSDTFSDLKYYNVKQIQELAQETAVG
jgi:nucleoside-diphosphate-sugar epimerase